MTWGEIDLTNRLWIIPGSRMKAGKEHRVPLTDRAMTILETVRGLAGSSAPATTGKGLDDIVFRAPKGGPLSVMALAMQLRRMGHGNITVHGFRSTFRDWAGEITSFPREIAEAALAHRIGDATERAYRRGDALEKRRLMMTAWEGFIEPKAPGSNVRQIGTGRGSL
jgi:integrase